EAESVGEQNQMPRGILRGVEVLGEERGRDVRECFGGVGEAFTGCAIDGELARRLKVNAGKFADRVVVLRVRQPPQRDVPRIAGARLRLTIKEPAGPREQDLLLPGGELRLFLWRHFASFDLLDDALPHLQVFADVVAARELLQVEAPLLDLRG